MSGGSMNYVYSSIRSAADMVEDPEIADLLKDLSDLLHDEEWWMSADYAKERYLQTLAAFKRKWFTEDRNERLKTYVDEQILQLKSSLYSLLGKVQD